MKRILLLAAVSLAATEMNAQTVSIAPEVGIYAPFTEYNSTTGNTIDISHKIGIKGGANVNLTIAKHLFLQSGLFFYQTGNKIASTSSYFGTTTSFKSDYNVNNLQLPLNIGYDLPLGKFGSVFATAGPYVGYALSGSATNNTSVNGEAAPDRKEDFTFGSDAKDNMKRMDVGFNFGVGIKMRQGVYVRAQYGLGLTQLSNVSTTTIKNRGISATLGYELKLGKKKK